MGGRFNRESASSVNLISIGFAARFTPEKIPSGLPVSASTEVAGSLVRTPFPAVTDSAVRPARLSVLPGCLAHLSESLVGSVRVPESLVCPARRPVSPACPARLPVFPVLPSRLPVSPVRPVRATIAREASSLSEVTGTDTVIAGSAVFVSDMACIESVISLRLSRTIRPTGSPGARFINRFMKRTPAVTRIIIDAALAHSGITSALLLFLPYFEAKESHPSPARWSAL